MNARAPRLGEILTAHGIVTRTQVEEILAKQRSDSRPFGVLCEELFGIDPAFIEAAWVDQYKRLVSHLEARFAESDSEALALVSRRQGWQFRIVPIRFDEGVLIAATTSEHLPRATRFASSVLSRPVLFIVVDAEELAGALDAYYPIGGLDARHVRGGVLSKESVNGNTRT
ncbi:MAG: hypothetical protein EXS00_05345 [Phycisphaerales bacterium]|nr:hypothetical protein [Phycisphaerales bacterium]